MAILTQDVKKPCLACGGTIVKAPQPTEAQRKLAVSTRLDYVPLPTHYDTAPLEVVQEVGELYTCQKCGGGTRVKPAPAKPEPVDA